MIVNMIFFVNESLKAITNGKEAPNDVVQHMLSSAGVGNECMKTFVEKCFAKQDISVFNKITKNKLNTGIKKPSKTPKPVEALKEDVQGFGILAEKNVPLNKGFKYPITKLPMSIAESKIDLRGASSASTSPGFIIVS